LYTYLKRFFELSAVSSGFTTFINNLASDPMAKSRFRYRLGVAMLVGVLAAFYKISARQNLPPADQQAFHNGFANHLPSYSFEEKNGVGQLDEERQFASFVSHATPALVDSTFWISAEQTWDLVNNGQAVLLDLRSYDDYQEQHPQGARSFSAARMPDLEATFPDKNQNYILLHWQNLDMAEITGEFARRGYHRLYALSMNPSRSGLYKMNDWEQANLPVEAGRILQIDSATIKLKDYEIFKDADGDLIELAQFPKPTIDLLLRYRPRLVEQYGFDEDNAAFRNEVDHVESIISAAALAEGKIWVGFSFYQSRRRQGYGGIGFYDLATGKLGVLRHPALVNHSVRDLMVTEEMIFAATVAEFELSRETGNGLVMIDRKNLQVRALVPRGTPVIWHKDGGENAALYYDKSIPEMLEDRRFIPKQVEGWEPVELGAALNLGLEGYMIQGVEQERPGTTKNMLP
jgi:rhodanese-related sulfurtransferase